VAGLLRSRRQHQIHRRIAVHEAQLSCSPEQQPQRGATKLHRCCARRVACSDDRRPNERFDVLARDLFQARDPECAVDENVEPTEQAQDPRFALRRESTPTLQRRCNYVHGRAQFSRYGLMHMLGHVGTSNPGAGQAPGCCHTAGATFVEC
jgi:hypothetical protein